MKLPPLLAVLLSLSLPALAQVPAATPPGLAVAKPTPTPTPVTEERTVYVPFEKLEEVFEDKGRGVFLPYREFIELWNKLSLPDAAKEKEPPVEGVLAAARYTGTIEDDVAVISATLDLEALKEGWSLLKIGAPGLNIAEAKSTASLRFEDGAYEVVFPAKGKYSLEMTLYGKIARDAGRNTLRLPLPRTAASQLELIVPGHGLDFTIAPGSAYTTVEQPDGSTKLAVYFGAAEEITIAWQARAGETALTPLLFAETSAEVKATPGALRTSVSIDYRILRSPVSAFEIVVPADQQVLSVDGEGLRDWTLEPGDGTQRVLVNLRTPAREKYTLRLTMEKALPSFPATEPIPLIAVAGVERQSGTITLAADDELVADVQKLDGLTQQSATPDKGGVKTLGRYRYLRLPYAGALALAQAEPVVEVSSETLASVEPELVKLRARLDYDVKKSGIFATRIALPPGFERAEATGDKVESSSLEQGVLEVRFSERRTGSFTFEITAEAPRAATDAPLTVPVLAPEKAQRHEGKVGVAVHVSLKANTTELGGMRAEDISTLRLGNQQVQPNQQAVIPGVPDNTPLTLGFRYRGAVEPAIVAFETRKPRVSVEVLTLLEVREALVKHTWHLKYNVEYAGIDALTVAVPAAIADDIHIEGVNIKERTREEEKDADGKATGRVLWHVALQDKKLGFYKLDLTHEAPQSQLQQGAASSVAMHEIEMPGVFRETGQVAVMKDGNLEFTDTESKGLEQIDPRELDPLLQQPGVLLSYKYATHPVALTLQVAKNLYLEVPTAIATYAVLSSVIAEDQAQTTEVVYFVRNNSQQFFSVALPEGGRMLSDAFVNGEAQQPSRRPDRNEMLIRLPARESAASPDITVRFVYELPAKEPGSTLWPRGTIRVEPPKLIETTILQTQWTLYLPSGFRYVKFGGAMQEKKQSWGWDTFRFISDVFVPRIGPREPRVRPDAWNAPPKLPQQASAGFDFQLPREGTKVELRRVDEPAEVTVHYRSKTYANVVEAICFFAALALGVLLIRASRLVKFLYVMIVGAGALIIAGAVAPRASGMWTAVYLGVLFAIGVWVLAALFATFRRARERRVTPPPIPPAPVEVAE